MRSLQADWFTKAVLEHTKSLLWKEPAAIYKLGQMFVTSGVKEEAMQVAAKNTMTAAKNFAACIPVRRVTDQVYFLTWCCFYKPLQKASPPARASKAYSRALKLQIPQEMDSFYNLGNLSSPEEEPLLSSMTLCNQSLGCKKD